jgi:uncharacterized protein
MDKNVIKQIILWQQDFVGKVRLQGRKIFFDENANYVLVGMRRAGKSYMLYQHIQELIAKGHCKEEILFVNFEDERISDITKEELHLIIECYRELFDYEPIIFLDEIQNVVGWEHFARRLADEKYRVFITGSNAHMLSREISSTLGGRYLTKEIFPFSFGEYLEFHGIQLSQHWSLSPVRTDVVRLFSDYFYYGGLSEMFSLQDKQTWLQSLYQKILYSDIVIRKGVRNEQSLRMLVKKLADSVMQPTAVKRLQNILQGAGTKITRETISSYLDYMHESYLTFGVSSFADSLSERETVRKHYFYDNGILNLFLFQPEPKLMENIVAIHLYKKYGEDLFYYNKNVEVDFCVPKDGLLVQVCYRMVDDQTRTREIGALQKVAKFLKVQRCMVITYDQEETVSVNGLENGIEIIPVYKFLLEDL